MTAHRQLIAATLGLLVLITTAEAAGTRHEPFPQGSHGDRSAVDGCVVGSYIVGFRAKTGAWFDKIGVICGMLNPEGTIWAFPKVQAMRGGDGGGEAIDYTCPTNSVVGEIKIYHNGQGQVQNLYATCIKLSDPEVRTSLKIGQVNSYSAQLEREQSCGLHERASGIDVRYGNHVNALGLWCVPLKPAAFSGCMIAGVLRKDIADSDCNEAQTTGCIQRLLSKEQYAACLAAQPKKTYKKIKRNKTLEERCESFASLIFAVSNKARSMKCEFVKGEGVWRRGKDELYSSCVATNYAVSGPTMDVMSKNMKQCEGGGAPGGGNPNAGNVKVLADNKVYKTRSGEDTPENTVCAVSAGDTADFVKHWEDNWVEVANVRGICAGAGGFIWDEGELQLP